MARNKRRTIGFTLSEFYCTECGNKGINIVRKNGQQREAGHLKNLYCIHCKKETNHVEIRPFGDYNYEDFKLEYELGRFVDGNRIPVSELEPCNNKTCKYNQNGKCWNANHSSNCTYKKKEGIKND